MAAGFFMLLGALSLLGGIESLSEAILPKFLKSEHEKPRLTHLGEATISLVLLGIAVAGFAISAAIGGTERVHEWASVGIGLLVLASFYRQAVVKQRQHEASRNAELAADPNADTLFDNLHIKFCKVFRGGVALFIVAIVVVCALDL